VGFFKTKYFICIKFIHLHCSGEGKLFLVSICQWLQTSLSLHLSKASEVFEMGTALARLNNELLTGVDTDCNCVLALIFRLVLGC